MHVVDFDLHEFESLCGDKPGTLRCKRCKLLVFAEEIPMPWSRTSEEQRQIAYHGFAPPIRFHLACRYYSYEDPWECPRFTKGPRPGPRSYTSL